MKTNAKPKRKPKKIEPFTPAWERLADARAGDYVDIRPCRECGGPVVFGYCCQRCGSDTP